jgi:hypothetical protein
MDDASAHLLLLDVTCQLRGDDTAAKRGARRLRLALTRGGLLAVFLDVRSERGRNETATDLGMLHGILHKNRQFGGREI